MTTGSRPEPRIYTMEVTGLLDDASRRELTEMRLVEFVGRLMNTSALGSLETLLIQQNQRCQPFAAVTIKLPIDGDSLLELLAAVCKQLDHDGYVTSAFPAPTFSFQEQEAPESNTGPKIL